MTTTATPPQASGPPAARKTTAWWRRPWIAPLGLVCVIFLAFSVPRYLSLDPRLSRVELREDVAVHYPLLVAHIVLGSIALIATCFQVWPWFRRRYPRGHRWIGWTYLFAGVFPASVMTLVIAPLSSQGPPTAAANFILGALWLVTGICGYRAARRRQYGTHRIWMIRGVALTWAIVIDRVWQAIWILALMPLLPTVYGNDMEAVVRDSAAIAIWLSLFGNLIFAEWWIQHRRPKRAPGRRRPAGTTKVPA